MRLHAAQITGERLLSLVHEPKVATYSVHVIAEYIPSVKRRSVGHNSVRVCFFASNSLLWELRRATASGIVLVGAENDHNVEERPVRPVLRVSVYLLLLRVVESASYHSSNGWRFLGIL